MAAAAPPPGAASSVPAAVGARGVCRTARLARLLPLLAAAAAAAPTTAAAAAAAAAAPADAGALKQTAWQRDLIANLTASARHLSQKAAPALEERLASAEVRAELAACSPDLAQLPAGELAARLRREVAVAEVVTGFPSVAPSWGNLSIPGMSIDEGMHGEPFFENTWQAGVRQGYNFTSNEWWPIMDGIETGIYGARPFEHRGEPRNLEEAAERAPYFAVNLRRVDAGSPLYGDVSAVLSPRLAAASSSVSAVDTGGWSRLCAHAKQEPIPGFSQNCSAYAKESGLGTLTDFDHLFLVGERYWGYSLGHAACRLLEPWGSTPLKGADFIQYWEALPMAELQYPSSIKFLIGSFPSLFGSEPGARLQEWCSQRGWVLVWSLGLNLGDTAPEFWTAPLLHQDFASDQRLADPGVLERTSAAANVTLLPDAVSGFHALWQEAGSARDQAAALNRSVSNTTWSALWARLGDALSPDLRLRPLHAGACADVERCVGTTPGGQCLCYQDEERPQEAAILV